MMLVLCLGCGMRVLALPDGSCPSCGARGKTTLHVWHGHEVMALVPDQAAGADSVAQYACLYLRPFAGKFRAAGRMQAVARAMHPFGTTVALHANEARLGLKPVASKRFVQALPMLGILGAVPIIAWDALVMLVEFVERQLFPASGLELVEVTDDRWQPTFRRLAYRARMIVMDGSAATSGVTYETEFIADLALGNRVVLLHRTTTRARTAAEGHAARLRAAGLSVPLVPYSIWRLHQLTADLGAVARVRMEGTEPAAPG
jgi:hypothetical protein